MAKIKLSEVPEEGRSYTYDKNTGELNQDLKDLIDNNNYQTEFFIKPLNHRDYSLRGFVQTATKETCSLCGETFNFAVKTQLNEVLIPKTELQISEKQSRSNHISENESDQITVYEYKNDVLEIGELIHEAIAISIPFNPKPPENENGDCSVCLSTIFKGQFSYDESVGSFQNQNPFSALKDLKLNKQ